jgi:glycerol-3-phosphate dehydrogenase
VVGGGITGAGVARDAALRGLRVVLLERRDFASGTSSRSSKLIHGGIRYLAQGDIALVREAARERSILRRIAPHLAQPLQMMIPASSLAARVKFAAGLWTFEKLAGDSDGGSHLVLDHVRAQTAEPTLKRAAVAGGAIVFTEYATNDARLVLETLQSAALAGAEVANYSEIESVRHVARGVRAAVRDHVGGGSLEIEARCLVNAAGPWFDAVHALVDPQARPATQLTKGVHVVLPRALVPVRHLVVLRTPDRRSAFVVPSGEVVYVGTTDTLYEGDPEEPEVSGADVDYLLQSVAMTLGVDPRRDQIVGAWSGVRPLLMQAGKAPSEISRRDELRVGPGSVVSIAGGKLTTYRRMAERVVDAVVELIRPDHVNPSGASGTLALRGGSADDQARLRAQVPTCGGASLDARLWATYGVQAEPMVRRIAADASLGEPIGGLEDVTRAEVEHAVHEEMAMTLDDVLRRRTRAGSFDTIGAIEAADAVATVMGRELGWDSIRQRSEASTFKVQRQREISSARGDAKEGER